MRKILAGLILAVAAGCRTTDAINRNYDVSKVRRIGVLAFDYGRHQSFGAEDIFAKHLLQRGYHVIERARLESVLKEQNLSATGVLSAETAKSIGRVLGVDAVVLGQITAFEPERKMVVMVDSHTTKEEPVFERRKERQADGKFAEVKHQVGKKTVEEKKRIPFLMPVDAEVGVAVKIVDIETGEVVWAGSDTSQGVNAPLATEYIAAHLVKGLSKKWRPKGS